MYMYTHTHISMYTHKHTYMHSCLLCTVHYIELFAAVTEGTTTPLGGYEHHFVGDIPDDLVCQICQLPARDPQQTTCCGKVYCKSCINRLQSSDCPNCECCLVSEGSKQYFPDKASDRRIKLLKTKCDHHKKGCKWQQELSQLEEHLTRCGLAEVECKNHCQNTVLRYNLANHLQNLCPLRMYKCPQCQEMGTYEFIATEHIDFCPEISVECPNLRCSEVMKRKEIPEHRLVCHKETIRCKYSRLGCTFTAIRSEIHKHVEESTDKHLSLAMEKVVSPSKSTVFKMTNFSEKKATNGEWFSPLFHTHEGGYQMCLRVDANGCEDGEGTHVSVFVFLMKGENDDNLVWPFQGEVTITLLNQLEDTKHQTDMTIFDSDESDDYNSRITDDDEMCESGYGSSQFVSHEELSHRADTNCQYLKDDSLYFRVSVKVHEACKPWLTPTT